MYLTNLEELKEVTDRRLIYSMARRLSVKNLEDYVDFCEWSVKDILVRRMNEGRYFEDKTHCVRYIALKVFKSCLKEYYSDKHNSTYAFDESFFTGEFNETNAGAQMLNRSDVITDDVVDYDEVVEFISNRLREQFPKQAEPYIQYQFHSGKKPKWRDYKVHMDLVGKDAIREYLNREI
tara:strand:- start:3745 stop:4281 length:537 start_codon:yes stop_codon:yes gene_type:complete